MSDNIRLNISVVILAGPDESSLRFHCISNHIINKSMFVPESFGFIGRFVIALIDLFKNILESSIIFLQDSVLGRHVKWIVSVKGVLEAGMGEGFDG